MIKLQIGSRYITVNDKTETMDVAPFLENKRTYVPVRFIAEALGCKVEWDEKSQTVSITNDEDTRYFLTMDECALDWAMRFNNMSIGLHKELGSTIYKNEKGYFYTYPNIGDSNRVVVSSLPGLEGVQKRLAIIHSHASTGNGAQKADKISGGDIATAKDINKDNYMASPCGTLQVYRVLTGKTETISAKIPYDRRSLDRLQGPWKYGDMSKNDLFFKRYGVGHTSVKADFYNELFAEKTNFPLFVDLRDSAIS